MYTTSLYIFEIYAETVASQESISILWESMICTIRTVICVSLGPRVTWYMDPTFLDMLV